jgi:hypothetical protein
MSQDARIKKMLLSRIASLSMVLAVIALPLKAHALTGSAGWVQLPTAVDDFSLFFNPLSVTSHGPHKKYMRTLMNYKDEAKNEMSLLSETIFNCVDKAKQDQFTEMFEGYWAQGEPVARSDAEEGWHKLKDGSVGMAMVDAACDNSR